MQTLSMSVSYKPQAPPGSPAIPSAIGQPPLLQQQLLLPSMNGQRNAAQHDTVKCMSHGGVYTCAGSALCSLSHAVYAAFTDSVHLLLKLYKLFPPNDPVSALCLRTALLTHSRTTSCEV